jgi:hypothetical protein
MCRFKDRLFQRGCKGIVKIVFANKDRLFQRGCKDADLKYQGSFAKPYDACGHLVMNGGEVNEFAT